MTEYETNLETLVKRLKQTGAQLIFANTTLVPEGEAGRFPGDEVIVRLQVTETEQEMGRPFDLVQFNWGQHALKWMQGKEYLREPKEGYTRCIPLERYGAELEKLVMELKKTGRPLMWAATTPANNGSKPDDAEAYNAVALQVMHKHRIPMNDLYRFVRNSQLPMQGCHFPREAPERLGNQVAGQLFDAVSRN